MAEFQTVSESELQSIEGGAWFLAALGAAPFVLAGCATTLIVGACVAAYLTP